MDRKPTVNVKKILRDEVGFGCPIDGCDRPYLEWHHFDPPWHEKEHGAFTKEQLHQLKKSSKERQRQISGRFNWLRNKLLVVVGGNFYYETLTVFEFRGQPVIWFERDDNDYLLLNIRMLSASREPRAEIIRNEWFNVGGEEDIECPPSAKRLRIRYPNGDLVSIEFFELASVADLSKRYPSANPESWPLELDYPITAVEVVNIVAGTDIQFNAKETRLGGMRMSNCFMATNGVALRVS
jgi:hypothetical protein